MMMMMTRGIYSGAACKRSFDRVHSVITLQNLDGHYVRV